MAATLMASFSLLRCSRVLRAYAIPKPFPKLSIDLLRAPLAPLRPKRCKCHITATLNEEASAKAAAASANNGGPTIFDKIISKEIPSTVVYEDDKVLAFRDIDPQAPVHVLVIPKFRDGLTQLGKAEARHAEILGYLLYAAKVVAEKEGIVDGFRVVINSGPEACQSVYHLHLHILGGRQMKWPPGSHSSRINQDTCRHAVVGTFRFFSIWLVNLASTFLLCHTGLLLVFENGNETEGSF